ncbi:MAG TPA: GNAT family N-acetyltransferase [Gemmatales bacterium]|nr:GNAT family N-acetyltransferase [Gemmatales bacterium]
MAPKPYTLRPHRLNDLPWVIRRHGELYSQEFGWDHRFEELVAGIVAEFQKNFDPVCERCWIAEMNGERVGCVFVVRKNDETAKLRMLLVDEKARGYGLGGQLIKECIDFARSAGYRKMILWTSDALHDARRLYEHAGFRLIEKEQHAMFGPVMMGQTWELSLTTREA